MLLVFPTTVGVGMIVMASFFEQPMIPKIPAKRVRVMNDCKRMGGSLKC
jgi:hypothetical protein